MYNFFINRGFKIDYLKERTYYTEKIIPNVWENVVHNEKMAELLVYDLLVQCMESFEDISLEITDEHIMAILNNWARNENISFGSNAITLQPSENGALIINCQYDMYKLKEDLETISRDLFETIDEKNIDENLNGTIDISQEKFDELFNGLQKKKVPYTNKEQK